MTEATISGTGLLQGVAPLPDLGVIRVSGADAASFLHGQLTQDFLLLPDGQARLAGYCSAKGRLLASFVGLRLSADELWLVCPRPVLAATLKRLSMFVLRAKAKLVDASAELTVLGLAGDAALPVAAAWSARPLAGGHAISLYPALGVARALWVGPAAGERPAGPGLDAGLWAWSEVRSGVATLDARLADTLVPQMLNYESVGGVSFKKGCYPGQEVVARSQFRGTLKRRTQLAHTDSETLALPGQEVFAEGDAADQPSGLVAECAASPQGGQDLLLVLQLASLDRTLHLGSPEGPVLTLLALPYPLLEDL